MASGAHTVGMRDRLPSSMVLPAPEDVAEVQDAAKRLRASQKELAHVANVNPATISRILAGGKRVHRETWMALRRHLGLELRDEDLGGAALLDRLRMLSPPLHSDFVRRLRETVATLEALMKR